MTQSNMQARYQAFEDSVRELGKQEGQGKDALTELYLKSIDAASEGIIDLLRDKHGKGVDDATHMYGLYAAENRKHARYQVGKEDAGTKAQISKLRKVGEFGAMTKFGSHGNPVDLVNKLVKIMMLMREGSPKAVKQLVGQYQITAVHRKLTGMQEAILKLARTQPKADHVFSNAELFDCVCKPEKEPRTLEDYIATQIDKLVALIEGTVDGGAIHCDLPSVHAAKDALQNALTELKVAEMASDSEDESEEDASAVVEPTEAEKTAEVRKELMAQLAADDNGMAVPNKYGPRVSDEYKARMVAMAEAAVPNGDEEV